MAKDKPRSYEEVKKDAVAANDQAKENIRKIQQSLRENEAVGESIRRDRRERTSQCHQ